MKTKNNAGTRIFTWKELKRHNLHNDAWTVIHNRVYDVTEWASKHPGGDIILLSAGIDGTIMFMSYHSTQISSTILRKFEIGLIECPLETIYDWSSDFYPTLKKRVVDVLKSNGAHSRDGMLFKAAVIMVSYFISWFMVIKGSYLGAILFGLSSAQIGLGIMHDGNHGSFSAWPLLNKFAGLGMDLIGSSAFTWEFQHVVGHHQYTNLESEWNDGEETKKYMNDPDAFSSYPLIRMHPHDEKKWYNRYQHIYALFLFSGLTISKVFINDLRSIATSKCLHIDMTPRLSNRFNLFRFYFMKFFMIVTQIAPLIYFHGALKGSLLMICAHAVCGEYLSVMFIVNHISESCSFYTAGKDIKWSPTQEAILKIQLSSQMPRKKKVPDNDWAHMQIRGCVNWKSGSVFSNHISGGLNHQIEHHLFPGMSHINYPLISKVVRETCIEYGIPYVSHTSFYDAFKDMIALLYKMGTVQ